MVMLRDGGQFGAASGRARQVTPHCNVGERKYKKIVFYTSEANMLLKIKDRTFEKVHKRS